MILNHITSRSRDPDQSGLANGPSLVGGFCRRERPLAVACC
jgi:hypothetical protein